KQEAKREEKFNHELIGKRVKSLSMDNLATNSFFRRKKFQDGFYNHEKTGQIAPSLLVIRALENYIG
ncbi:hypothetical protein CHS0354_002317, partial [Potamilus streckersoni]